MPIFLPSAWLEPAIGPARDVTRSKKEKEMDSFAHPDDRRTPVSIEANDFSCEGLVHLPGIRLSDVMNESSRFLVLVDAVVLRKRVGTAEQTPMRYKTIFVRKDEIKYVVPMDERPVSRL
jgi:Family of unknown function (DUF6812)